MLSSEIRSCAFNLLARREHSKFELQHKLKRYGFSTSDIEKLIQELVDQNLQSDARFTESYINMRRNRGFGPVRIQAELWERGIDKEQGKKFLHANDPVWSELARIMHRKKFGKKISRDLHERTRQIRYLYYKGFTSDHIKEIFNHENFGN